MIIWVDSVTIIYECTQCILICFFFFFGYSVTQDISLVSMEPSSMRTGYPSVPNTWTVSHVTSIHTDIHTSFRLILTPIRWIIRQIRNDSGGGTWEDSSGRKWIIELIT